MSVTEFQNELTRLSNAERLKLLEVIWASIEDKDALESPAWHKEELRLREEEITSGETKFVPWEEAKADILRRTS